uniref:Uncharacterized protein n=1 Tax=Craspedostauros australis TaxID=1486917 RepID=A0A7R9WUZ9_9STRA
MPTLKTTGILACSLGTLCGMPRRVDAFCMQRHRLQSNALRCAKYSDEFLQRVEEKLVWEKLEESTQKPVLDLSKHRGFLASDNSDSNDDYDDDYDDIPTIVWDQTKSELEHLGIHMKDEAVQQECPQLYRLDTAMVLDTAQYLLSQNYSATSITPKLLSFHASDVEYGLEFLKTMMMNPNVSMSTLPAALLLSGIEGGIQERAVQSALSSASDATSQANQRIVGDIQSTIRQRKKFLGKKMP